uniref:Uncharacterized protein n=1 Tax=Candidatus Kentrum sp. DK TaxID=2126562 RepID=A0A450SRJ9_9GAMM|nr:MAG: hypothetical protein BECKDK2373B_GA0170837_105916 [Candidatus Kentron sp. DK]
MPSDNSVDPRIPIAWQRVIKNLNSDGKPNNKPRQHWSFLFTDKTNRDVVRYRIFDTVEYEQFFWRALMAKDGIDAHNWTAENFDRGVTHEKFREPLLDEVLDRVYDADLVAHLSLTVAWVIGKALGCSEKNSPSLITGKGNNPELSSPILRFLSADFVIAEDVQECVSVSRTENGNYRKDDNEGKCFFYRYHSADEKEFRPTWEFHGWRMESERRKSGFKNNPYNINEYSNEQQDERGIETFMAFPAFFSHDCASPIFYFFKNKDNMESSEYRKCSSDDSDEYKRMLDDFYSLSVESYKSQKQGEFLDRSNKDSQIQASLSFSFGVPRQHNIYFDPKQFDAGYGVFFTVDFDGFHELDSQKLQDLEEAIRKSLPDLRHEVSQALNIRMYRKLEREREESEQRRRALERSAEMLRLLMEPLDGLTQALAKTQADTQELRAILYSPARGLFAAAPKVWPYFEEHRIIHVAGTAWQVKHGVSDYEDPFAVAASIAVIVCAVFGREVADIGNGAILYERFIELLDGASVPFGGLRKLCWLVLCRGDHNVSNSKDQIRENFGKILRKEIREKNELKDKGILERYIDILLDLKDILFSPFKIEDSYMASERDLLPLWLAIFGSRDLRIQCGEKLAYWANLFIAGREHPVRKASLELPVPQYNIFLEFISGVVEAAMIGHESSRGQPEKAELNSADSGWELNISFDGTVFKDKGIHSLFSEIASINRENRTYQSASGNFRKPFLDFTKRISESAIDSHSASARGWNLRNGTLKHENNNHTVEIKAENDSLSLAVRLVRQEPSDSRGDKG